MRAMVSQESGLGSAKPAPFSNTARRGNFEGRLAEILLDQPNRLERPTSIESTWGCALCGLWTSKVLNPVLGVSP